MQNDRSREIKKSGGLTILSKVLIGLFVLTIVGVGLYYAPILSVSESKTLSAMEQNKDNIDNITSSEMLSLPSMNKSTKLVGVNQMGIAGYAWNGESGIIAANGGPVTTSGSIMEKLGVNLRIDREDWFSQLQTRQVKFVEQFDSGIEFPNTDKASAGIMIMGDGAPYYISTVNKALKDKFGDKYHVEVVGAFGMSNGEDKLIGPLEWKTNPKSMIGSVISVVPGDGDWVTVLNYCFANGLKVNPNLNAYDKDAVNFLASKDDDYINSAKELIGSQTNGVTYEFKEIVDGQLTGKTVKKLVTGCATWTPGDAMVFESLSGYTDVASTKDFPNQMATTLIVVKEWAAKHPKLVSNVLKGALTASNQIKQYDEWGTKASEAVYATFKAESPEYWKRMFKGENNTKGGVDYSVGGSRVLNYADVMQYYGITDGQNRYKSVYNQVSNYLTEMNPFNFIEAVGEITPYNEAVNLFYLKNINDINAGTTTREDYTKTKTDVMANGEWHINFDTGSNVIQSNSYSDVERIYNLLVQAEQTKINVIGHTDNTGSKSTNDRLSLSRAQSVVNKLISMGINRDRIQTVDGKGSQSPIESNSTNYGRSQNRRVQITFLK